MSLTTFLIPLINEPQQFEISLAGVDYLITSKWNNADDAGWVLDIADSTGNPIICNIPLVVGADLLDGLDYLGLQGSLTVVTNGDANAVPTLNNLGTESNLYFQTEVASV